MRERGLVDYAMTVVGLSAMIFLAIPILMIFPLSIDPNFILKFPPTGFTFKWYERFFNSADWIKSTLLSLEIATYASLLATAVGTAAAIGLARWPLPGRKAGTVMLMCPILLPHVVVAIAIYGIYVSLGLVGTKHGIALAHSVLGVPFVFLNVTAALRAVPRDYEDAAASLGSNQIATLIFVTLPLIWRGVLAGAIFAFVVSFDEVVIAMFLSSPSAMTLPKRLLDGIFYDLSPVLAAVSAILVLFNVTLALAGLSLAKIRQRTTAGANNTG